MKFHEQDTVVSAPSGVHSSLYKLTKAAIKAANMKQSLVGTKDEVLARAAKINAKSRRFTMPADNRAYYTDHMIGAHHCLEIGAEKVRSDRAILFVFGGGMILGPDAGDIKLSGQIAKRASADVWFPYYPLCHEYDMLENVQMIFVCYQKMLQFYDPEKIIFLGFSSGAALLLDLITYINERNEAGSNLPMPGLLIPISPGSVPVTEAEKENLRSLESSDIIIPVSYMELAKEIMQHGHDIPEKYIATAHGDFRNAPMTHFYYGGAESLYAFAPSYAESFRNAGAKCVIHVGEGMHHCYAIQYFIPGCKEAFEEIMTLIIRYFAELSENEKPRYEGIESSYRQSRDIYDDVLTQNQWWSRLYIKLFWGGVDDNEIAEKVLSYIPEDFSGTLLDVPVGTAVFTCRKYAQQKRAKIICLDYSEDMLAQARKKLSGLEQVSLMQGDVGQLPFENAAFDIVLSMNGFHAFPDKRAAFRETYRVLKRGGKFIGCYYLRGESAVTDTLVKRFLVKKGWFTPPFDTASQLRRHLQKGYDLEAFHVEGSMVYFCAVKRGREK